MKRINVPSSARRRVWALTLGLAMAAVPMAGCQEGDGFDPVVYPPDAGPQEFTLQILHASDMEADGEAVEYAPRFSAILNDLRSEYPESTVVLSSGDNYLPGPFFSAGESTDKAVKEAIGAPAVGRADIALLNAMGFQASAMGNHEFDQGPAVIADLLQSETIEEEGMDDEGNPVTLEYVYPGTSFPYLSVNLDFTEDAALGPLVGPDRQLANILDGQLAKSAVIKVPAGELVGVVGATTPTLASISSPGGDIVIGPTDEEGNTLPEDRAALAALIQAEVDALTTIGIDKIILLSHMQQIAIEEELAALLSDVDVIIAGGSNTILADSNDRLRAGDTAVDTYPRVLESASDEPVLVINTDGNFHYVGRLVVTFDIAGVIKTDELDPEINGVYAADEAGATGLAVLDAVSAIAEAIGEVISTKDGNLFGKTTVFLDGLRTSVRTEETNLGNLVTDANLAVAKEVDPATVISIKNSGSIRAPIGVFEIPAGSTDPADAIKAPPRANPLAGKEEGQISQLDIENALRFNNDLSLITLTAAQLQTVVEHGVAAVAPGATPGQFPQIAGMRFSYDPSKDAGKRVVSLIVEAEGGDVTVVEDGTLQTGVGPFRVVTSRFLVEGGDGYSFPTDAPAARVDLLNSEDIGVEGITFAAVGSEQHALAKYLKLNHPADGTTPFDQAETPAAEDTRIQRIAPPPPAPAQK
jgi:2',3'-cyclic-nucleotide 2'-phosphodiesterase (5'-nucleotidase family)